MSSYNCIVFTRMVRHLSIKIFGRVQGVLFRHTSRREAEKLGLSGFVRNEPDGSVYIEAEGKEDKLGEYLEWCRRGPTLAKVEKVDFEWSDKLQEFHDFSIF